MVKINADKGLEIVDRDLSVGGFQTYSRNDPVISSGAITVTTSYARVDTEASAASDDLDTINGGVNDGQILILRPINDARTVVVKNGTGNIVLNGDCTLENLTDTLTLMYNTATGEWIELSRGITQGGEWTFIEDMTFASSSDETSSTFTAYDQIKLVFHIRGDTSNTMIAFQVNGNTGTNYAYMKVKSPTTSVSTTQTNFLLSRPDTYWMDGEAFITGRSNDSRILYTADVTGNYNETFGLRGQTVEASDVTSITVIGRSELGGVPSATTRNLTGTVKIYGRNF